MIRLCDLYLKPKEGYDLASYEDRLEGTLYMFQSPLTDFIYDKKEGFSVPDIDNLDYRLLRTLDTLIDDLLKVYTWERVWEEATIEDKLSLYVRLIVLLHACDRLSLSEGSYSIYVKGKSPFEVDFNPTSDVVIVLDGEEPPKEYWGLAELDGKFDWKLNSLDFVAFADNF